MSTFIPPGPPAPYGARAGAEETTTSAAPRGSYGPVIGMLAVVLVLAAAAVAAGRLCFGRRRALGRGGGLEAWVERTCGHCVGAATPASGTAASTEQQPTEGAGQRAEEEAS